MSSHLVSIGLPIVKSEFLIKSITCCLNQTYSNLELIILNNASSSIQKDLIREIVSDFNDLRILYFENQSQIPMVQNWNKTVELASGQFFTILCDDDFWEPTFLEELVLLSFKYPKTNIFHSRSLIVDEDDKPIDISGNCPEFETGLDFIIHRLRNQRTIYLSDFLVRTSSLKEINGFLEFPDGWGSDVFTWFELSKKFGVGYIQKPLMSYRISSINVSNSKKIKGKLDAINLHVPFLVSLLDSMKTESSQIESLQLLLLNELIKKYRFQNVKNIYFDYFNKRCRFSKYFSHILSFIFAKFY
jgi:glycosyltransferase involved in cell wall biosynthesis